VIGADYVPHYRRIERALRERIGHLQPGDLEVDPGDPVVVVQRLRCADDEPMAVETAVLDGRCAPAVLTADLEHGSLHEALGRAGFSIRRGTGTISAGAATADDARLLAIRTGDPLLIERRVILDAQGRPIEATESRYAAARYALDVSFDVVMPAHDPTPLP
jgi:GntR family transcriptional regulator